MTDDLRTEADLVAAAQQGDRDALERLALRYQPRVYRFGLKMCRDAEDAADIAQESLLAMARSIREFRGEASVSTWLFTIARSFCIKKRRRSKFAPRHEGSVDDPDAERIGELTDPAPDPERQAVEREMEAALSAAIDSLDAPQREVLILRDVEGLSAADVSQVTGLSVQAVKSRLHRARLAVRDRLSPLLVVGRAVRRPITRCPDTLALLSRHLEGDLAPDACAEMEAHLERCGLCRDACDSLRRTLALCRAAPPPRVPAPLRQSIRRAIRAYLQETA